MDQVKRYQDVIRGILRGFQQTYRSSSDTSVEMFLIADDEHGHYLILKNG